MKELEQLKENLHLISEAKADENGNLIRIVDGKEIVQIPETTQEARRKNELINLWRMRNR